MCVPRSIWWNPGRSGTSDATWEDRENRADGSWYFQRVYGGRFQKFLPAKTDGGALALPKGRFAPYLYVQILTSYPFDLFLNFIPYSFSNN